MTMPKPKHEGGFSLFGAETRIYVECEGCRDGANGPNNRHGAAIIQGFTAGHKCTEETQ